MKVPVKWLSDYVNIDIPAKTLADMMTMSGSKVESVENLGIEIEKVIVGRIKTLEKHPGADKLQISQVETDDYGSTLQIVTGATNISVGDYIPVAIDGSKLPGGKEINAGKLRGVDSNGMMCSIQELGYTRYDFPDAPEHGIYLIDADTINEMKQNYGSVLGMDIRTVLGLDDEVIEFEITPNRPDCLSITGIARETAATIGSVYKKPVIEVKERFESGLGVSQQHTQQPSKQLSAADFAKVEITAPELCPRYAARIIKNVKIGPSPAWMKRRLRAAGVRPINNIVDITNYVMLEMGQPMHAFDLENVKGSQICVRRANDGEILETLDGQKRILDNQMLVIADKERAIAVAGVMGGGNSEISDYTTTILFESANFNGTSVRITSKKLGMRTEASSRFEKGLDVNNTLNAINRAAQIIEMINAGEVVKGIIDCYPVPQNSRKLKLDADGINRYLGTNIGAPKMVQILNNVELDTNPVTMEVTVPTFRQDVEEMADLAEEIARFHDYNNIKATLLSGTQTTIGERTWKQKVEDMIRNGLISSGYSEAYTFSFNSPKVFDMMNLPQDDIRRNFARVSNPLGEDMSIMRTTTLPDMLSSLSRNYSRRVPEARLYELSYVYLPWKKRVNAVNGVNEESLPYEAEMLTLGAYGNTDFFEMKGAVQELFELLGIKEFDFEPLTSDVAFHPGRTAKIIIQGEYAGQIGEVHPAVCENYEIEEKTYAGIIEVEMLLKYATNIVKYRQLPRYPAMTRDIAVLVPDSVLVKNIETIIRKNSGKIFESVKLFDVYKGKQVGEGKKSVAYSMVFRAEDRTLTDDEVNSVFNNIVRELEKELSAQLRE